jgi:hypothetical protein
MTTTTCNDIPVSLFQYDDYNWDWSLLYVSLNCLREKLLVMMIKGPRVFHIGEWYVCNQRWAK